MERHQAWGQEHLPLPPSLLLSSLWCVSKIEFIMSMGLFYTLYKYINMKYIYKTHETKWETTVVWDADGLRIKRNVSSRCFGCCFSNQTNEAEMIRSNTQSSARRYFLNRSADVIGEISGVVIGTIVSWTCQRATGCVVWPWTWPPSPLTFGINTGGVHLPRGTSLFRSGPVESSLGHVRSCSTFEV